MSSPDQQPPPGWLTQFRRGAVSGVGLLLIAFACCAVAAFAAWLMPGTDTTSAGSALKAAALVVLAGAHGGLVLAGTPVSLTPLLVTMLLGWLVAGHARRLDSWSGFAGLVAGYGAASAALAHWSRLGTTSAPVLRSTLAALLLVLVVGGVARSAGQLGALLPHRWRCVLRAAALVAAGYLVAGSLLAAGALLGHFSDAVAVQRQVAPGAAGLAVALLGLSAAPNAVLAAVGYLTGPGFQVGTHTSVSAFGVSSGRLPMFPLLAGVPHGRPMTGLAVAAMLALALLAGWAVLRTLPASDSWWRRLLDCSAAALLAGATLAILAALAGGDLGSGTLRGIGTTWWAVGVSAGLLVLLGSAVWLSIEVLRTAVLPGRAAEQAATGLYALKSERDIDEADSDIGEPDGADAEPAVRSRNAS